jgi:arylamine N-acetyltransferase
MEFLPQDYEMMSWFTSTSPKSFFTRDILCTKMLMDEAGEKIVGDITLFNNGVRKTEGGKRENLAELKIEQDRIDALKNIFHVDFTEEEKTGITPGTALG